MLEAALDEVSSLTSSKFDPSSLHVPPPITPPPNTPSPLLLSLTMTSIGTGYDLSASTYSPDGRIFQVRTTRRARPDDQGHHPSPDAFELTPSSITSYKTGRVRWQDC